MANIQIEAIKSLFTFKCNFERVPISMQYIMLIHNDRWMPDL